MGSNKMSSYLVGITKLSIRVIVVDNPSESIITIR